MFYKIKRWFEKHTNKEYRNLLKTVRRSEPWDHAYLLELERAKIKEMIAYQEKTRRFVGWEYVVRDMKICVSLLDIMLGDKRIFTFEQFDEKDIEKNGNYADTLFERYRCFVKVNMKNYDRFCKSESFRNICEKMPHEFYEIKATQLYYKIRAEHTEEWWD